MSTQITSGYFGSSPQCYYILYAEQLWGSGTRRGIRVYAQIKVNGSGSSSYGYPLSIRMWAHNIDGNWMWCKGNEFWYGTDGIREYYQDFDIDVGTNSSTSIGVGFRVQRSDGGSSSWNGGGGSGYFTVGSTNTAPSLSGIISTSPSGTIAENTKVLSVTCPEASDNEGNLTGYRIQMAVNKSGNFFDVLNSNDKTRTVNVDISGYGEGTVFEFRADAHDSYGANSSGWITSYYITKNTLTPNTLNGGSNIEFNTDNVVFTFSGAKNTYTGTNSDVFTMSLSSNDITVYNQNVKTSPVTLSIYKNGTLPTGPYIKFSDLIAKFKGSSYKGSLTFVLTTSNAFGTSKTSSKTLSVNLQIAPNPATSQQISLVQSESTAYLTIGTTSNKYFIPDGSKVVRIKWNAGSGKLGEDIKYELYVAYGSGSWQKVADLTQGTNYYNHVIPKQTISQQFKYMIRTICSYNTSLYTDAVTTAQTLHFYNTPTLTVGTITRTSTTADVQVTVKSNSSIPNINTVGSWKCCSKGTTTVVSSGSLGQAQIVQVIKVISLTDAGTYDLSVTYKDDTGFSSNVSITISIGQNLPAFFVNKYGAGIGGVKAEAGKELNIQGSGNILNDLIVGRNTNIKGTITVGSSTTLNGAVSVGGTTTAKLVKTTGLEVSGVAAVTSDLNVGGVIKEKGYTVYHTGRKPTSEDVGAMGLQGELGDNKNLDNYRENGVWFQQYDSSARTGTNYPIARAGVLVVKSNPTKTLIFQSYRTYGPFDETYTRTYHTDYGWLPWKYEGSGTVEGDGYGLMRVGKLIFVSGWNTVFSGEESSKKVWYPTTFPTKTLAVTITQQWVQGCNGNGYDMVITALDNDGFWMNPAANTGRRVLWMAVGH
ncbi:pyocin knob domain-containing protein [Clostridium cadaveris]|uniref:Uncharacterized protein n=1 Tax=Clostridium cadaveris TaxID=1529 RepID=A0A1I2NVF4_9CLOT|nr:pyocin knob domain-containing protein [Clostridium cadaveris]SFG05446.1 hypothetical protein SAMN04487885_12328 [Clostridium cadaveris]